MGVYYSANIAWGLKVEEAACPDDFEDGFFEWVEQLNKPMGFSLVAGGNAYVTRDRANHSVVIGPQQSFKTVMDKYGDPAYGVFKIDSLYEPTDEDWSELVQLAKEIGIEPDIGWFTVSKVS